MQPPPPPAHQADRLAERFHHGAVGEPNLAYEGLEMAAGPGLTLIVYTAEPGSSDEEGLRSLATWVQPR